MAQSFPETAHLKTDVKKYGENLENIFGPSEKKFCDNCGLRISYCECDQTKADESCCMDGFSCKNCLK